MNSQTTNKSQIQPAMSRRDFLKLTAATGIITVGGYVTYEAAPWLNYEQGVQETWGDLSREQIMAEKTISSTATREMRELVHYATLAANGHNTQPWHFAIQENAIEIHPDYTRHLPIVDPTDRALWISLGCALENLAVAARAAGYTPEVVYPTQQEFICVNLTKDTPQPSTLFDAIPQRQNTRSEYDGRLIELNAMDALQNLPFELGVGLHFVMNPADMESVIEYINEGNLTQYADQAFVSELIEWLRFNKREALASHDGLYSTCSGNPQVPRWLGCMFVAGTKPQQQADSDAKKLRSSAGAVVIASDTDDKATWVRIGQVYERLALKMTSLNIKSAFLNQPIEVAQLRSQFQSAMGLDTSLPQLLLRFGYADPMPRSLRRPVEQVII